MKLAKLEITETIKHAAKICKEWCS